LSRIWAYGRAKVDVETEHGTDEEALGYLEHTGKTALYVVKRRVQ